MKSLLKGATTKSIEALSKHLDALHCARNAGKRQRAPSKLTRDIEHIHLIFYGDVDHSPNPQQAAKVISKLLSHDLFLKLIENQRFLEFDAKKQSADIIAYAVRRCARNHCHTYIGDKTDRDGFNPIIHALLSEYTALGSSIIHEMVKRPELAAMLLTRITRATSPTSPTGERERGGGHNGDFVEQLLNLAESDDFNVSTNAYRSLSTLLLPEQLAQRRRVAAYLERKFDRVLPRVNALVQRDNFARQKQFLSLLFDLLTGESNRAVRMRYVSQKDNLAAVLRTMHKFRNNSVSLLAYQVLKLFLANPHKAEVVRVALLRHFHDERAQNDAAFARDRRVVMQHVKAISIEGTSNI